MEPEPEPEPEPPELKIVEEARQAKIEEDRVSEEERQNKIEQQERVVEPVPEPTPQMFNGSIVPPRPTTPPQFSFLL